MSEWYLVYCKVRQEDTAAKGLEEQGYIVYLPKMRIRKRRSSGVAMVEEPLFPRYLFVSLTDKDQSISPVQYTRGVQNLVKFGTQLMQVPGAVVATIREREDPETGFHRLEMPGLKVGDQVQIKSGAFAGLEGIFKARSGKERVIVLLSILGQQVQAEVPIGELGR
jgi:transcriptional antiterminator RfaH